MHALTENPFRRLWGNTDRTGGRREWQLSGFRLARMGAYRRSANGRGCV